VLRCFEEALSERVWEWAKVLLIGAILAPGERSVTAILRVMGLHQERQFQNYHRVLNRAKWSSRTLSRLLLRLLIQLFVPEDAPIVVGIDETTPRRRGAKIAAKAILEWFVLRWQMEVTFHEVRAHLGVETQRQWSDLAILRTTPALVALFSLVMVFAHQLLQGQPLPVRQAAW
jgi:DDE superfamily endonuclease